MRLGMIEKIFKGRDGSHLTQYLTVGSAIISLFTTGLHLGWLAPSLPKLLSPEYPFEITPDEASYIAIVGPLGHVIGGFVSSYYLNDSIGRKNTILLTVVPQVISFILVSCSFYSKYFLYFARVIGSLGEGTCLTLLPAYIGEITEPSIRGRLGAMISVAFMLGSLFINLLGSYVRLFETAAICLIFPVIFLVTFSQTPESPYYLLMKNQTDKARASLQMLRRKSNVEKELIQLTSDVQRQMSETGSYKDLFTIDSNKKALGIAFLTRTFQQLTGMSAFGTYFQILLGDTTNLSPVMSSSFLIVAQMLSSLSCSFYIGYFGRKTIFAFSSLVTSMALAAFAIHVTIRDYTTFDLSHVSWLPLAYLLFIIIGFQCGLGAAVNVYIGEIFSASIKAKALSLMSVVFAFYLVVTTKFYQFTADNFGLAVPLWVFAISTFMGTWFFIFVLPETKGKTLETIQQELKGKKLGNGNAAK